jgi:hypothetical protein
MSLEQSDLEYLQRARLDQIPDLEVEFDARGIPRELRGQLGFYFGEKPDLELRRLLSDLGPACRAANTESLKQFTSQVNRVGIAVYRIGEFIEGPGTRLYGRWPFGLAYGHNLRCRREFTRNRGGHN